MSEEVRLILEYNGIQKNLLWMSFQDDDAISLGFLDQAFVFPGFTSERELEDEKENIDLRSTHSLAAITNPHFTLHPPGYFHLRSGNNPPLLSGLVWTEPDRQELVSPWIRFVSNPVETLSHVRPFTPSRSTRIQTLHFASDDCSIAINVDFVDERAQALPLVVERKAKIFSWREISMLVYAYAVPSQPATLGYLIRG